MWLCLPCPHLIHFPQLNPNHNPGTLTVRETLQFSAELRLPSAAVNREATRARVEVRILELSGVCGAVLCVWKVLVGRLTGRLWLI